MSCHTIEYEYEYEYEYVCYTIESLTMEHHTMSCHTIEYEYECHIIEYHTITWCPVP
jgi:hypothetical protein